MAPGILLEDTSYGAGEVTAAYKPTVYLLDDFHPIAVKRAKALFNLITPTHPDWQSWRENAEFLLVKGSTLTASDIKAASKLRAIGKQGVGIDKIDAQACKDAGVAIINTPGVNATAVAELVLTLTMSVA